jgi:very-short-patch-repair endonuclease
MRQQVPRRHLAFARQMRAEPTKAENLLWQAVRNRQLEGLKFKRQQPVDGVIVDFVCFEARLIVEVDGGQHSGSTRDVTRDDRFAASGYLTLRFWNDEVERDIDGVCATILDEALPRRRDISPLEGEKAKSAP